MALCCHNTEVCIWFGKFTKDVCFVRSTNNEHMSDYIIDILKLLSVLDTSTLQCTVTVESGFSEPFQPSAHTRIRVIKPCDKLRSDEFTRLVYLTY